MKRIKATSLQYPDDGRETGQSHVIYHCYKIFTQNLNQKFQRQGGGIILQIIEAISRARNIHRNEWGRLK